MDGMSGLDCIHLTSGDGSLAILEILPDDVAIHLHLLEPHRGLHEDVLHRRIDGSPKRNLGLTKAALTLARKGILQLSESSMLEIGPSLAETQNLLHRESAMYMGYPLEFSCLAWE